MNRREFVSATAACAVLGVPGRSVASIPVAQGRLMTVSDGSLALPVSFPKDVSPQELAPIVARHKLIDGAISQRTLNLTLWQEGDRVVLFDAGSGPSFVDTAGALYENLEAAGFGLEAVTDVVFTHAHPDHIWGILDDFDEIAFPEARLWIGQAEYEYWSEPANTADLDETRQFFAVGAERRLAAIADRLNFFGDGDQVLAGVTARATYGHTPGHMSFVLGEGRDQVMVLGDAVTNDHLHLARPGWQSAGDQNPQQAARSRVALLADVAAQNLQVTGYHLPGDGIGRIEVDGDGYRFVARDA